MTEKTKLTGGLDKTVTWIWLDPAGGQLIVEFYDFSETAQEMLGNDIAYILTVNEMKKLFSLTKHDGSSLIEWMATNFKSYFDINHWLEENQIAFSLERESWA
ncbi:MAG: hypothetical protein L0287_01745 [Anaerolineae bacterium]|nr:hypothetical protein [Anaerolineae bacterium]